MSDSNFQSLIRALTEDGEQRLPDEIVARIRGSDNLEGFVGVIFDLYASIPNIASPAILFIAQRLQNRGGVLSLLGEFVETIPPTSRMLRGVTGKTTEEARADVVAHWRNFSRNPRIGALMATPATASPATTPTPAAVPVASYSRVQRALSGATAGAGYSDTQQLVLLYMFRLMRIEATPGTDIVAELEGEAAVAGVGFLNTLRDNADDIKNWLSGPDFDAAVEFVGEIRDFENHGCQSGPNLEGWRRSAENFVRRMIPAFEFLLVGQADRNQGTNAVASGMDMLDRLHLFAGLQPSSAFVKAQAAIRTAANVSKGSVAVVGALIIYGIITLWIGNWHQDWLPGFAWGSTVTILGVSALMMAFGWIVSGAVQVVGVLLGFYAAPMALTLVWVITAIFTPTVDWFAYWVSLLVIVTFDFVSINLLQKGGQTVGAIPAFIKSIIRMEKEHVDALSKELAKTNFLVNISATVASAIVLAWIPLTLALALNTPQSWRIGGITFIAILAIAYGYLKRGATMKVYGSYAGKLGAEIEKQDILNLQYGYNALRVVTAGVLAAFIVVRIFGAQWISETETSMSHGATRAAGVVSNGGSKVLDYAENAVGSGSGATSGSKPAARQPRAKTKAEKKAEALEAYGGRAQCDKVNDTSYPCN